MPSPQFRPEQDEDLESGFEVIDEPEIDELIKSKKNQKKKPPKKQKLTTQPSVAN
jgi:hypothetical protein